MRARCSACEHFEPSDDGETGDCRAHPPQVAVAIDGKVKAYWPLVTPESWCGEFRPLSRI